MITTWDVGRGFIFIEASSRTPEMPLGLGPCHSGPRARPTGLRAASCRPPRARRSPAGCPWGELELGNTTLSLSASIDGTCNNGHWCVRRWHACPRVVPVLPVIINGR